MYPTSLPPSLPPPPQKSQFIRKCLSPTFFRNTKAHHESKTKSWTSCAVCPQSRISLWTVWTMKKMKSPNFYKKKSQRSVSIILICCFSFTVSSHFITTVLFIFCGASHLEVQFEIAFFNCFCHKLSCW